MEAIGTMAAAACRDEIRRVEDAVAKTDRLDGLIRRQTLEAELAANRLATTRGTREIHVSKWADRVARVGEVGARLAELEAEESRAPKAGKA